MSRENTIKYFFAPILGGLLTFGVNIIGIKLTGNLNLIPSSLLFTQVLFESFITGYSIVLFSNWISKFLVRKHALQNND